jgi:peroxiredoxin
MAMTRRRLPILVAALLAAVLALGACTGKDAVDQTAGGQFRFVSGNGKGSLIKAADRKPAGNFTGDLLNGGKITLNQYRGKVVVINFWATWCGPCTTETPQFDSVYRSYKSKGVQFIGIDTKEASKDAPKAFVRDNDISYPIVWDEQGKTAVALGKIPARALPFTVLIDRKERVAAVYLTSLAPKDLEPVLNKLVAAS